MLFLVNHNSLFATGSSTQKTEHTAQAEQSAQYHNKQMGHHRTKA
jgi:hypothetical protein